MLYQEMQFVKVREGKSPILKIPYGYVIFFLICSFIPAQWMMGELSMNETAAMLSEMMGILLSGGVAMRIAMHISSAVVAWFSFEIVAIIYYNLAFRFSLFTLPFTKWEFVRNLRVFMIGANLIQGLLSLLYLLPSNIMLGIGLMSFELFASVLAMIPFFLYMNRCYVQKGHSALVLRSMALPYLAFNLVFNVLMVL